MNTLALEEKRGAIQCWHCGKFRRAADVAIRRDWETGDWNDVQCSVCREAKHTAKSQSFRQAHARPTAGSNQAHFEASTAKLKATEKVN